MKKIVGSILLGCILISSQTVFASTAEINEDNIYPSHLLEIDGEDLSDSDSLTSIVPKVHIGNTILTMKVANINAGNYLKSSKTVTKDQLSSGTVMVYTNITKKHKVGIGYLNLDNALISIGDKSFTGSERSGSFNVKATSKKYYGFITNTGSSAITSGEVSFIS